MALAVGVAVGVWVYFGVVGRMVRSFVMKPEKSVWDGVRLMGIKSVPILGIGAGCYFYRSVSDLVWMAVGVLGGTLCFFGFLIGWGRRG